LYVSDTALSLFKIEFLSVSIENRWIDVWPAYGRRVRAEHLTIGRHELRIRR